VFLVLAGLVLVIAGAGLFLAVSGSFPATPGSGIPGTAGVNLVLAGPGLSGFSGSLPAIPRFYRDMVPAGTGQQWINLTWTDPAQPRSLIIYSPASTLGPYYNSNNGIVDQRIYLLLENDAGLTQGPWYYEVRAENGSISNVQSLNVIREPAGRESGGT
jgi:hypothetical protein